MRVRQSRAMAVKHGLLPMLPPVTGAIFGQSCVSRAGGGAEGDPGRGEVRL
jgi:hypothetical protein